MIAAAKTKANKPAKKKTKKPVKKDYLFEDSEWTFEKLDRTYEAIADIAFEDLGLDIYANQIEIISSEQMLDAYASHGMPLMYRHWSFGKSFVREEQMYRKGYSGLAYEIVINSNPCISYNMEENTMAMQTLVMAHAAFGHNHFFKNNYLFRQWTDADGILDYLNFAKSYIADCEEKHGVSAVEELLDSAHAIMDQGVFRYSRRPKLNLREQLKRKRERQEYEDRTFNDLWRTVPEGTAEGDAEVDDADALERKKSLKLPEENLLYFLEKNSPALEPWQREIVRIVRHISQYFYPQKQTKVMNEGCATFVHHYIINELHNRGRLTDGALLEMLHSHANVLRQPDFDDKHFGGINPYALGFAMMTDIKRIATEPEDEDREWFPELAGSGDWRGGAERRVGQLPRRVVHPPVFEPASHARHAPVRARRRRLREALHRRRHPQRAGLPRGPRSARAPLRPRRGRPRHPGLRRRFARRPRAPSHAHNARRRAPARENRQGSAETRPPPMGLRREPQGRRRRERQGALQRIDGQQGREGRRRQGGCRERALGRKSRFRHLRILSCVLRDAA